MHSVLLFSRDVPVFVGPIEMSWGLPFRGTMNAVTVRDGLLHIVLGLVRGALAFAPVNLRNFAESGPANFFAELDEALDVDGALSTALLDGKYDIFVVEAPEGVPRLFLWRIVPSEHPVTSW